MPLVLIQLQSVCGWCRIAGTLQGLTPDMSTRVYCSSDMLLLQGCTCHWDQLDVSLQTVCDVLCVHGIFINMIRIILMKIPCTPAQVELSTLSRLSISISGEAGDHVGAHQSMKHWQYLSFLMVQSPSNFMSCQEVESLPRAKGHPHFSFLLQGVYQSHYQDNKISVNCADEDFLVAIVSSVGGMQHYEAFGFFVVARSQD